MHVPAGITDDRPSIWISYAPAALVQQDVAALTHQHDSRLVATSEYDFEALKIGAGPPPIRVPEGWLLIHHGVSGVITDPWSSALKAPWPQVFVAAAYVPPRTPGARAPSTRTTSAGRPLSTCATGSSPGTTTAASTRTSCCARSPTCRRQPATTPATSSSGCSRTARSTRAPTRSSCPTPATPRSRTGSPTP